MWFNRLGSHCSIHMNILLLYIYCYYNLLCDTGGETETVNVSTNSDSGGVDGGGCINITLNNIKHLIFIQSNFGPGRFKHITPNASHIDIYQCLFLARVG